MASRTAVQVSGGASPSDAVGAGVTVTISLVTTGMWIVDVGSVREVDGTMSTESLGENKIKSKQNK